MHLLVEEQAMCRAANMESIPLILPFDVMSDFKILLCSYRKPSEGVSSVNFRHGIFRISCRIPCNVSTNTERNGKPSDTRRACVLQWHALRQVGHRRRFWWHWAGIRARNDRHRTRRQLLYNIWALFTQCRIFAGTDAGVCGLCAMKRISEADDLRLKSIRQNYRKNFKDSHLTAIFGKKKTARFSNNSNFYSRHSVLVKTNCQCRFHHNFAVR